MSDEPTKEERKHHRYSPSSLPASEACAGFLSDHTSNPKAERGNFLHDCIEKYIKDGTLHSDLDDEEAIAVRNCGFFVAERMKEMGPETELYIERHVKVDEEDTTSGYLDIGLFNPKTGHAKIIDWKTGLQPVDSASNNLQGIAYMLGLIYETKYN